MKILVTGGKGFIASHYIRELQKKGHECIIYDLPENDICSKLELRIAMQKVDMCVHFAAMADVTVCIKKQQETFDVNVIGTFNIGQICAEYRKKLIFISTCCVYGNSMDDVEFEDTTQPQAAEPYAVSKVAGEALIKGIPHLDYIVLRIGTVYGIGMREALFTYIALNNIKHDKTVYIDGDGNQSRQLIYIDDLVDGIVRATDKFDEVKGETFNLCGIEKTSALDTVDVAEKIVGKPAIRQHREQRYGQTFEENITIKKANSMLGWLPMMTFYDGMKYTYEHDKRFK